MDILIVILIISFLVILHELGHYFAAIKTKTNVEEFGIGYPPRILTLFKKKGTLFSLNAIPFGGFVRLEGEMGEDKDQPQRSVLKEGWQGEPFYKKSAKSRMLITLAGVILNILFALVSFSIVFSFVGIPTPLLDQARIGAVEPMSPADEAGLPIDVNILRIETDVQVYEIKNITDVQQAVSDNRGQILTIVTTGVCEGLSCNDSREQYEVYARTEDETPDGEGSIGVGFSEAILAFYPWYQMPFRGTWFGIKQAISLGWLILKSLVDMFVGLFTRGALPKDVAGPVGIVHETHKGNIISDDFLSNLGFAGMLSLNLAIMNLLPIPALDGGRALFILLEKVFGKKSISKIESYANYGGFVLLILLIIAITIKDLGGILKG